MSRLSLKLIAAAFAAAAMFSLSTVAGAEKGKQVVECANTIVDLSNHTPAPGEELFTTIKVSNCSKDQSTLTVEEVLTDSCGNSQTTNSTTLFKLRRGETRQVAVNLLAPDVSECGATYTITARVLGAGGSLLAVNSSSFTVTSPAP